MIVIITGASDGIGAELARQWAAQHGAGLRLVLNGRQLPKLQAVAAHCEALGATVLVHAADLSTQAACEGLIQATTVAFGGIDVLVNNAGMSAHALLEDVQDLAWYEQLMRVNHWSAVWCSHAALPWLKASQARLVAVSSLAGLVGVPGRTAYSATKFAMTGFFEALRVELQPAGVSVTIAYPGVVATEIRYRGYGANGQPAGRSGLDERGAMSVDTCARLILDGTLQRERDIVMSAKGKLGRWLKLIAPGLVDRLALKALNKSP